MKKIKNLFLIMTGFLLTHHILAVSKINTFSLEAQQTLLKEDAGRLKQLAKHFVPKDNLGFPLSNWKIAALTDSVGNIHQLLSLLKLGGLYTNDDTWVEEEKPSAKELEEIKGQLSALKTSAHETSKDVINYFRPSPPAVLRAAEVLCKKILHNLDLSLAELQTSTL